MSPELTGILADRDLLDKLLAEHGLARVVAPPLLAGPDQYLEAHRQHVARANALQERFVIGEKQLRAALAAFDELARAQVAEIAENEQFRRTIVAEFNRQKALNDRLVQLLEETERQRDEALVAKSAIP